MWHDGRSVVVRAIEGRLPGSKSESGDGRGRICFIVMCFRVDCDCFCLI